jgi:hypothetical protein
MEIYYNFLKGSDAIIDLERGMIKVSQIDRLNDIFELMPYSRVNDAEYREIKRIRNNAVKVYGIVCFSKIWSEPLLWGHYADHNKGIALGFDLKRLPIEVHYEKDRERDKSIDFSKITIDDYVERFGKVKYKNWKYEDEFRFFVKLDECMKIEGNYFFPFKDNLDLKEIIIGPKHPCLNKKEFSLQSKYLIELANKYKAIIIASRAERGGYKIVRCGTWTDKFDVLMHS